MQLPSPGEASRNMEAGTDTETRRLPDLLSFLFKYNTGRTTSLWTAPPSGLGPPTSIISQENAPMYLPMGQSDGDTFSIEDPSSQMMVSR